jgi:hypothetical protein
MKACSPPGQVALLPPALPVSNVEALGTSDLFSSPTLAECFTGQYGQPLLVLPVLTSLASDLLNELGSHLYTDL